MEAVLFIGMPAVGKSTFYRERFFKTHVRINLDMLKTRNRERILFEACLKAKQSFVVDNTNPTAADRLRYIEAARTAGFSVIGYYFQSRMQDSLLRNEQRSGRERVPAAALRGIRNKIQPPGLQEGFDELYYVRIDKKTLG
ncbi:MAG: AAA family ATPase [Firmicutes bacterium]|nr:AAA family ATPase [Bacillota bacterium]